MSTEDGFELAGTPVGSEGTGARSAGAEIYERLKHDILTFSFLPGERLVELELCDRYNVSRTPVREALRRLEDDGVVLSRARGGRVVRSHDIAEYADVYTVRSVLEVFAVRDLARRVAEIDIDALEHDWQDGYPAPTTELDGSYVVSDERFHLGLVRATGNMYLVESLERIHDRLHAIRSVDFTVRERLITSADQHLAMIAAIRDGDGDLAAALMQAHISQSRKEIRGILLRILSQAYSARS